MRTAVELEAAPNLVASRESPIDLTELRKLGGAKRRGDVSDVVDELIELFFELAPQSYALVRAALAEGDCQSLGRAAHRLKSQAAYFGARRMAWVCRQLEQLGYEGRLARCGQLVDDLEDELDRVMLALSRSQRVAQ
jgi:two-component system, sensor histidine kinase and response regulator